MGIIYTDSYETRTAYSSVEVNDVNYMVHHVITSPIDGNPNEVSSTFYRVVGENKERVGYGRCYNGASSMGFDNSTNVPIVAQCGINEQFMNDLKEIFK